VVPNFFNKTPTSNAISSNNKGTPTMTEAVFDPFNIISEPSYLKGVNTFDSLSSEGISTSSKESTSVKVKQLLGSLKEGFGQGYEKVEQNLGKFYTEKNLGKVFTCGRQSDIIVEEDQEDTASSTFEQEI
jgi:hypothetical protein